MLSLTFSFPPCFAFDIQSVQNINGRIERWSNPVGAYEVEVKAVIVMTTKTTMMTTRTV